MTIINRFGNRVFGPRRWTQRFGDFRDKERMGLIERPQYAYGMLRAADLARYFGKKETTAVEFGVAQGNGLLNMADLAGMIEAETGVRIRVVGFDTGKGLPEVKGHKDHVEIWSGGDFPMLSPEQLRERMGGRAELVLGDIAETVDGFVDSLSSEAPLGFVSVDVDIYTAAKSSLRCLEGPADKYLPAISMYFDDVAFFFANRWCGELSAMAEFNDASDERKIDQDRSLPGRRDRPFEGWYRCMYVGHILDHVDRNKARDRSELTIADHHRFMNSHALY